MRGKVTGFGYIIGIYENNFSKVKMKFESKVKFEVQ